MSGRPAAFIDRDGTLITEREYLADPQGVELIPGAADALRRLADAGYAIVVVTNQSGIGRGYYTEADYQAVRRRLEEVLAEHGVRLDGTYHCPHDPDVARPCDCRKPGLGLYRRAASELGLDPATSVYIGDKLSDVLPGLELGGTAVLVRTGYGEAAAAEAPADVGVADDLAGAARLVLGPE